MAYSVEFKPSAVRDLAALPKDAQRRLALKIYSLSLSQTLQRPAWITVPKWALNCALGEVSSVVLSSQRAFPKKIAGSGFKFQFEDLLPALFKAAPRLSKDEAEDFERELKAAKKSLNRKKARDAWES